MAGEAAIVVMSADGRIRDWNAAAERTFGYTHSQTVGRDLASLIIPHALRERHREALARFTETGEATIIGRPLDLFALHADGTLIPVALTVTLMEDADPPLFAGYVHERKPDA